MSSPEKKKTTATKNPSLPDDLLLSCFARVSKLYYPTLSLASKSFPSLLTSPELYRARSLVGLTESCLYVCLRFTPNSNPRWFTLCRKPNLGYVLAPIPIPHSPQAHSKPAAAVVGSDIYFIGGPINESPSSSVSILDCRFHTWREGPSMLVKRSFTTATVFNEKIYVAGGCKYCDPWILMEVLDPKTQTWEACGKPSVSRFTVHWELIHKSVAIKEDIVVFGDDTVGFYSPIKNSWGNYYYPELDWAGMSSCTIDNVLYTYYMLTKIKWYDSEGRYWKEVKGLESLPDLVIDGGAVVRLVDYGGQMVVLWDKLLPSKEKVIWCAVISLQRRNNHQDIWGNIEWLEGVLTVPNSYEFVCALAPTV